MNISDCIQKFKKEYGPPLQIGEYYLLDGILQIIATYVLGDKAFMYFIVHHTDWCETIFRRNPSIQRFDQAYITGDQWWYNPSMLIIKFNGIKIMLYRSAYDICYDHYKFRFVNDKWVLTESRKNTALCPPPSLKAMLTFEEIRKKDELNADYKLLGLLPSYVVDGNMLEILQTLR